MLSTGSGELQAYDVAGELLKNGQLHETQVRTLLEERSIERSVDNFNLIMAVKRQAW